MSDEQVSELRYIEELEAEVEKLQRSTVHALYQGQKKRAAAAEAEVAELREGMRDDLGLARKAHEGTIKRLQRAVADRDRLAEALRDIADDTNMVRNGYIDTGWPGKVARAALASLEADQSKETV